MNLFFRSLLCLNIGIFFENLGDSPDYDNFGHLTSALLRKVKELNDLQESLAKGTRLKRLQEVF